MFVIKYNNLYLTDSGYTLNIQLCVKFQSDKEARNHITQHGLVDHYTNWV